MLLARFGMGGYAFADGVEADGYTFADEVEADEAVLRPVSNTIAYQFGYGQMRDSYLTPLLYGGRANTVRYDRARRLRSSLLSNQQTITGTLMTGDDKGNHSESWAARASYHYALHFGVWRSELWSLAVGPYSGAEVGFDYNLKLATANNPATVHADVTFVGASATAAWHYRLGHHSCLALLSVQAPLAGSTLMPDFGGSYYETFYLDDYAGSKTAIFTSLHNEQNLDVRLTTDLPVALVPCLRRFDSRLTLGVDYRIETMKVNHIVRRFSTIEAVIGWTYQQLPYHPTRSGRSSRPSIEPW